MSAIDDKLRRLKEQEENLKLEQLKIEFLRHIEKSVIDYKESSFAPVKEAIVGLVKKFVADTIGAIEGVEVRVEQTGPQTVQVTATAPAQTSTPRAPSQPAELSANEKMNFALDNRHLAGKQVSVANDKNIQINGTVVGLDAPNVLVKTETGPTIKVPLEKVSLK